ncbi:MAG: carbohydrate kinase, partial [Ignavibacteriae bacterium]|nr:carbohydrate kinase [Ignavibacteriota bacterium]
MAKKYLLGFDIGSSSVKVSILNSENGKLISSAFSPNAEMKISSPNIGWAEQNPEDWWKHLKIATKEALANLHASNYEFVGIGISYQMHGLVLVNKDKKVLRPSIIWCDSRAVGYGDTAFDELGSDYCLGDCLNSPGNFTASKLKWVKENEPNVYEEIYKFMLPGDYIAMKLSGEINTTISGLSEGIIWDFKKNSIADDLLKYYLI